MAHEFRPVDRDQQFLMPPSLDEWVPAGHPVRFVVDAVAALDLSEFEAGYRLGGVGRRAYHPALMVTLLLWAYSNGVFSSREIERRCVSDVTFRFVTGNQAPDHATTARFRQAHAGALKGLHVQVLAMCAALGLVRVGLVALDGTKLAANASKDANRSMAWIEDQIRDWFDQAERTDAAEDDEFGDARGDEVPADVVDPQRRLERLAEIRDRLAAEQAAKGPRTSSGRERRVNVTDPDSALMPTSGGGWVQGYNAQAVATTDRVVIATEVTDRTSDSTHLLGMAAAAAAMLAAAGIDERVGTLVADAGYWSTSELADADPDGPDLLIATGKSHHMLDLAQPDTAQPDTAEPDTAEPDVEGAVADDAYQRRRDALCRWADGEIDYQQAAAAAGVSVPRIYELRRLYQADPRDPLGTAPHGQDPKLPASTEALNKMRAKLATPQGQAAYRQRAPAIEGVFGDRKHRLGFRRLSRRGIDAAASEWSLINTVGNLDKARRALTALVDTLAGRAPAPA